MKSQYSKNDHLASQIFSFFSKSLEWESNTTSPIPSLLIERIVIEGILGKINCAPDINKIMVVVFLKSWIGYILTRL